MPILDEEIQKYHAQIRDSVKSAQKVNDSKYNNYIARTHTHTHTHTHTLLLPHRVYRYHNGGCEEEEGPVEEEVAAVGGGELLDTERVSSSERSSLYDGSGRQQEERCREQ